MSEESTNLSPSQSSSSSINTPQKSEEPIEISLQSSLNGKSLQSSQESPSNSSISTSSSTITTKPSTQLSTTQLELLYGQTLSVIIPNCIYLSDYQAAIDDKLLQLLHITHIINASNGTVPNQFPQSFQYYNVNIEDEDEADITPYFNLIDEFLANSKPLQDQIILFHCRLGISRSPTLVIAYLMKHYHYSLKESYDKIKLKRSKIQPTLTFCKALLDYERVVFPELKENSITIQALCGGNHRYSIVSRQSMQRQSSIEKGHFSFSNSNLSSQSNSMNSPSLHLIKEDELQKRKREDDNEEKEEKKRSENDNNEEKKEEIKESSCCCCCIL